MTKRPPSSKPQLAAVERWNGIHPVGVLVKAYRGLIGDEEHAVTGRTRTRAELLSGHTAVVWVTGCSGCIALSHVVLLDDAERVPSCA